MSTTRVSTARAFTLIEMIGVLAVIAILAAVILPVAIRRMDRAAWTKEFNDLGDISKALSQSILKTYTIPNETSWAAAAANWTARPASQISTNNRGFARLFFYDSGGWMTNASSAMGYTQANNGTLVPPANARIVIVSTISKALTNSSGPLTTANFNSIWDAALYTKPSFLSSWTGKGDDLVIQRICLDPLFHRLLLINRDGDNSPAAFSINSTNVLRATNSWASFAPNSSRLWSSYYLDGTVVGLCSNTVPAYRFVFTSDVSYVFDASLWRAQLTGGGSDNSGTAQNFANYAATFVATPNVPGNSTGGSAQGALSAFYTFMYAYALWANECPHFNFSSASPNNATEYQVINDMGAQNGRIDSSTGTGGLLK